MADNSSNLIEDAEGIRRSLRDSRRLAILGIKPEDHSFQPAHYVPRDLQRRGWEIIPVPVYYPDVSQILGQPVYRKLIDIPDSIDMVIVFRRPHDIPPHVPDIIAKKPKYAWFQLGIRNEKAAAELAAADIKVIQDRCAMVEARYL